MTLPAYKICCICNKPFTGYGNNPYPVCKDQEATCCDECNLNKVIPARIILSTRRELNRYESKG